MITENYDDIMHKLKYAVKIHSKRNINMFQKVHILNCYILSKIGYVAQIFPAENKQIAQIPRICKQFIFNSFIFKVQLQQLYLNVEYGGLSLIDVESKMKALFIKNLVFMQGDQPVDNFMMEQKSNKQVTRNTREWIILAEEKKEYPRSNTCILIYRSLIQELNITPKIEQELPNLEWEIIWENVHQNFLSTNGKNSLFMTLNDIVPCKDKLFRHAIRGTSTNLCEYCGVVDSSKHRIKECKTSKVIWEWVSLTIINKMNIQISDPEELIVKKNKY